MTNRLNAKTPAAPQSSVWEKVTPPSTAMAPAGGGALASAGRANAAAALAVLRSWTGDPGRYASLSEAARAAAPLYRWPIMAERLVRLYDTLLPA